MPTIKSTHGGPAMVRRKCVASIDTLSQYRRQATGREKGIRKRSFACLSPRQNPEGTNFLIDFPGRAEHNRNRSPRISVHFRSLPMSSTSSVLSVVGIVSLLLASSSRAQEDMVANPFHKFWAASRPGATAVHVERTKLSGDEGKLLPDAVDEKRIEYKVVEVNKDRVVLEMV